jgi:hypothetical protein
MAGEFTVNDSPLSILQAVSTDKQTSTPFGNGPGRGDILNARIWFFTPFILFSPVAPAKRAYTRREVLMILN